LVLATEGGGLQWRCDVVCSRPRDFAERYYGKTLTRSKEVLKIKRRTVACDGKYEKEGTLGARQKEKGVLKQVIWIRHKLRKQHRGNVRPEDAREVL